MEEVNIYFIDKNKVTFISNTGSIIEILDTNPFFGSIKSKVDTIKDWSFIVKSAAYNYASSKTDYTSNGELLVDGKKVDKQFKKAFEDIGYNIPMRQWYLDVITSEYNKGVSYKGCLNANAVIIGKAIMLTLDGVDEIVDISSEQRKNVLEIINNVPILPRSFSLATMMSTCYPKIVELYETFWKQDFTTILASADSKKSLTKNNAIITKFSEIFNKMFKVNEDLISGTMLELLESIMTSPTHLFSYCTYNVIIPL